MSQVEDIVKSFSPKKILLPVILGFGVTFYLIFSDFDRSAFSKIHLSWNSTLWILISFVMVGVRDLAYMYRIRVLTGNELSWRQSFDVIMLWEFSSAVAPPILGGGFAFAIMILNKEKVKMGKSISVVMFSSFLDGLFFAIIAPLIYIILGQTELFAMINASTLRKISYGIKIEYFFWIIYFVILFWKLIVAYALFFNPRAVKFLFLKIFSLSFLRKWKFKALQTGNEMEVASRELKGQGIGYWFKSFAGTFVSWSARYLIVNCIVMAFTVSNADHFIMYARQVVMGLILLVVPSPGGSGFAEFAFGEFLGEFIPLGLAPTLALLWRLISYYPYLIVGSLVLPRWLRRVFTKEELHLKEGSEITGT